MKNVNIHAGHRERLKEQILKTDISKLSDIHFLEHLLTFVIPRADTNPIAHKLLIEFKTVANIFNADPSALTQIDGIGEKAAHFLHYMATVYYFYKKSSVQKTTNVGTINKAIDFIESILPPSTNEQFIVLILNKKFEIKNYKIFNGVSHSYINFDAKELSTFLINNKTSFCILAHTHPNGSPLPSSQDSETFKKLTTLLDSLAIVLYDSLILGDDGYFSGNLNQAYPYLSKDMDYKKLKPLKLKKD